MSFIQKAEAEEERALEDASEPAKNETIANGRDGNLSTQREREREREREMERERENMRTQSDLQREILLPVAVALRAGVDIERGDFVAQSLRPRDVGGLDGLDELREF